MISILFYIFVIFDAVVFLTFFIYSMEKSMLLDELFALHKADKAEREQLLAKLDRMTEQLLALNENS